MAVDNKVGDYTTIYPLFWNFHTSSNTMMGVHCPYPSDPSTGIISSFPLIYESENHIPVFIPVLPHETFRNMSMPMLMDTNLNDLKKPIVNENIEPPSPLLNERGRSIFYTEKFMKNTNSFPVNENLSQIRGPENEIECKIKHEKINIEEKKSNVSYLNKKTIQG